MSIINLYAVAMLLAAGLLSQPSLANDNADTVVTADTPIQQQSLATYRDAMNYLLGRNGRPKSAEKAAELFQTLAEKNWSSAQRMLGYMYYEGKGVEQNNLLAYKWLSLATRNNTHLTEEFSSRRRLLQSQIPASSLQEVDKWIAEWQPES